MKIVFVSNYINHHQIPFCNAMYAKIKEDFTFIQMEPMEEERIRMGWNPDDRPTYVKYGYQEPELCSKLVLDSDVVIWGGAEDETFLKPRLEQKKPVIRYSERLYRTGQWKAVSPRGLKKKYLDHTRHNKGPVCLLCAGAYVPSDFQIIRAYPNRKFKWGYFPETKVYNADKLMEGKKPAEILWVARLIPLKHPELPIETARYLRDKGYAFHLNMVGGGECGSMAAELIQKYDLQEFVTLCGVKTPEEVREYMESAEVFLMTSDRNEGWGAVINEAMNSGCAVVANHMIGSVPFLLEHRRNGLIYKDGKKQQLFEQTESLIRDRAYCHKLGRNAYETIIKEWNAETAAQRLCDLCERIFFEGTQEIPETGPCSVAPVISEQTMYRQLTAKR